MSLPQCILICEFSNSDVWKDIEFPNEAVEKELKDYIGKRLTPQPTKVRADVEVTCFGYEGIDAVKTALRTAEARNTPDNQVKVKLVSPPLYVLTSTCLEKNVGISTLEASILDIRANIEAAGGSCIVKMEPKAVTENDDAELQALMEKREKENAEVSGLALKKAARELHYTTLPQVVEDGPVTVFGKKQHFIP